MKNTRKKTKKKKTSKWTKAETKRILDRMTTLLLTSFVTACMQERLCPLYKLPIYGVTKKLKTKTPNPDWRKPI